MKPTYIAIEGVIGAGKTTLAHKLAQHLQGSLLLEKPDDNPFLPRFYRDREGAAFSTQMTFLLQRAGQMEQLHQLELFSGHCIADFMFEKDRLFAEINLGSADYSLYAQVFERLAFEMPRPDRLIYLTAPLEVLMQRVMRRGRDYENPLESDYLELLSGAYARWFQNCADIPLIEVDAAEYDLLNNEEDFSELLAALESDARIVRLGRNSLI